MESQIVVYVPPPVKKITYASVEAGFDKTFNPNNENFSTICDIIALYIKAQKTLYTEAKTHCEQRLTFLMLPAISITVICSVLGVIMKDISYGSTITSILNGINAFILALVSYLKLDTRAEAHRTSAYKFDKLQSKVEFTSGKMLFVEDKWQEFGDFLATVDKEVREIKATNQFVLPEPVRISFSNLYNTNFFAVVKTYILREKRNINRLKDLENEKQECTDAIQRKIVEDKIKAQLDKLIAMQNQWLKLDKEMSNEILTIQRKKYSCCNWFKV